MKQFIVAGLALIVVGFAAVYWRAEVQEFLDPPEEPSAGALLSLSEAEVKALQERARAGDQEALDMVLKLDELNDVVPEKSVPWFELAAVHGDAFDQIEYADLLAYLGRCKEAASWARRALASSASGPAGSRAAAQQRIAMFEQGDGTVCPPYHGVRRTVQQERSPRNPIYTGMRRGWGPVVCGKVNGTDFMLIGDSNVWFKTDNRSRNQCTFDQAFSDYCENQPPPGTQCRGANKPSHLRPPIPGE